MEDHPLSDGESEKKDTPEPLSPKAGGKKLKLNDGSSQESLPETVLAPTYSQDENVDSGVSADKSTSSDDKSAATAGPSNEVVHIAASGSNVRTIMLNIRQPLRRNYRKRRTPDRDTDSNSSRDSDDFSAAEDTSPQPQLPPEDNSDDEFWIPGQGLLYSNSDSEHTDNSLNSTTTSDGSSSSHSSQSANSHNSSQSANSHNNSTDNPFVQHSGETDTDDEPIPWGLPALHGSNAASAWNPSEGEPTYRERKIPDVLLKERPKHNYLMLREIINREMGLTFPYGKTAQEDVNFCRRYYGSLQSVYKMKNLHNLHKHRGCVNSINFHPEGNLLVSGSDDTSIIVWNWARNKAQQTIRTGHKSNVFQSKFMYLNAQSQLNIVTCARDGQVRLIQCPPSGGTGTRRRLLTHSRAAHKLHVCAQEPHSVISAGEDALVMHADVRTDQANRLFQVKDRGLPIPIYSVHGHPLDPKELIVAGKDKFIRMYDRRKSTKPVAMYSPTYFYKDHPSKMKIRVSLTHLTCAIYNHNGSAILGSYNDEDIYLFDAVKDVHRGKEQEELDIDGYSKRYSGHRNSATFKGVSFFGPNSEYVVSGSDCSHIYMWSTKHESIVQWMKGDVSGVVNCIETHPKCPVMATSGLDRDIKIWMPSSTPHADPTYEGLERIVRKNGINQSRSPLFNDFLPTLFSAWQDEHPFRDGASVDNINVDVNVCSVS